MTFQEELSNLLAPIFNSGPDLYSVLFSLTIAAIMGLLISQLYRRTHRGLNYEHTFMATLVMMAPIVAVVMLYIRGDLVLSLGLIGSLSIVRFRTPIKDTRDMVFLFWVIAVGLGTGTYNWGIVVVSSLFISIIVGLLYFFRYGNSKNTDFVLVITGDTNYNSEILQKTVKKHVREARIRSFEQEADHWEVVFEIRFSDIKENPADTLVEDLNALDGIARVSLLAPQLALPL